MANNLFPDLPKDLGKLTNEELQKLLDEHNAAADLVDENDAEFLGDRPAHEILAQYDIGLAQMSEIVSEQENRRKGEEVFEEGLAEKKAKRAELLGKEEPKADESEAEETEESDEAAEEAPVEVVAEAETEESEAEETETETVEEQQELETVAASAEEPKEEKIPPRRPSPPASRPAPKSDSGDRIFLRASGGLGTAQAGEILDTPKLVAAMIEANEATMAKTGASEKVVVGRAKREYPVERQLSNRDVNLNLERIYDVIPAGMDRETLIASGGLCAPLTPIYDLPVFSIASRPVRDSLPAFQASRGGVSVPPAITMADVSEGVDIVTAEQDGASGTFSPYPKTCLDVTCEAFVDYEVSMIYACVTHGNLGARAWPERVRAVAQLQAAWHARIAEGALLDGIDAASTATTATATYGGVSSLLNGLLAASAGMRSRHRLDPETRLRALLPDWARSLLVADLVNSQYDRFEYSIDGVRELLSRVGGVNPVFYLDQATGSSQIMGAEAGGTLNALPTDLQAFLYPEGSFIFLDLGTLDLGIVRDSVLNETNDFQTFMETFEGIAFVGIESLKIDFTICPSGVVAAPATGATCPFFD